MSKLTDDELICRKCGKSKPLSRFANNGNGYTYKDGKSRYKAVCKDCLTAYQREWKRNNPQRAKRIDRAYRIKVKYGITRDEYAALLKSQNGTCALCGAERASSRNENLNIDHNHETGQIRGLLCTRCNTVIGLVNEDISLLSKMVEYLKEQGIRPFGAILDEASKLAEERRPSRLAVGLAQFGKPG